MYNHKELSAPVDPEHQNDTLIEQEQAEFLDLETCPINHVEARVLT